jgi:hypothetical protein
MRIMNNTYIGSVLSSIDNGIFILWYNKSYSVYPNLLSPPLGGYIKGIDHLYHGVCILFK